MLILFIHLYGAILHKAFKRTKSALPIGMLLWVIRMFPNIQERETSCTQLIQPKILSKSPKILQDMYEGISVHVAQLPTLN